MKKILIFLLLLPFATMSQNIMQIGQYSVGANAEITINVEVQNTASFVAFQVDIPVPQGFLYIANSANINAGRANGHLFTATLQSGNILRLMAYSVGNTAFSGNSGTVASFSLRSGSLAGDYPLSLNSAVIGNDASANILTSVQNGSVKLVAPNISLSATELNFGRVALLSSVNRNVTITNTGNSDLLINGLSFSGGQFSISENLPLTIAANANRTIAVTFAPTVKGTISQSLIISSNVPEQNTRSVSLNAVAFAVNELRTGAIAGASGTTRTLEFTINNMESFTGFQFDIALPIPMTYVENSAQLFRANGHTVAVNLVGVRTLRVIAFSVSNQAFSGENGKVLSLDFALEGVAGNYPVNLNNVIIVDASGENILSERYNNTLRITSADIRATATLNFGQVSILEEKQVVHRISNAGQEPLVISQMVFTNPHFSTEQSLPLTIAAGGFADISVKFSKNTKSVETGIWRIFSNDPRTNPFDIAVSASLFVPNKMNVLSSIESLGEIANLGIEIENYETFTAFQFDLTFPEGLTLEDIQNIALTERKQDHLVSASLLSDTVLRIVAFSLTQKPFLENNGAVVTIPFTATEADVSFDLSLSNILISNVSGENILWDFENGTLAFTEKDIQTITFPTISAKTYGNASFTLPDTTDKGLIISYHSSDTTTASVLGNVVTIRNAGTTEITATQMGNPTIAAAIPVTQVFTVNKANLTITAQDKTRYQGQPNPVFTLLFSDFQYDDNESKLDVLPTATCEANETSPVGFYDIVLSGGSDRNYNFTLIDGVLQVIEVPAIPVTDVTLTPTSITMNIGESRQLTATISPSNATNQNVSWSSSAPNVVTVLNGQITAISAGTATITVTTIDGGFTAQSLITVNDTVIPNDTIYVAGVQLADAFGIPITTGTTIGLEAGETKQLFAKITPENATNQNVTWSSSNTNIVTVSSTGLVTAVAEGTATVYVHTDCGNHPAHVHKNVSNSSNIVEVENDRTLSVYPNPITNGRLFVEIPESTTADRIEIYDFSGKLVLTQVVNRPITEINISHLPNGTYIVRIGSISSKIIKNGSR
jgi:uncharacterized protein YjdB